MKLIFNFYFLEPSHLVSKIIGSTLCSKANFRHHGQSTMKKITSNFYLLNRSYMEVFK